MSPAQNSGFASVLIRNTVVVIVAALLVQLAYYGLTNKLESFMDDMTSKAPYILIYALVFAYLYEKISRHCYSSPRAKITSEEEPQSAPLPAGRAEGMPKQNKKPQFSRWVYSTIFGILVSIVFWSLRRFALDGGGIDSDEPGLPDMGDVVAFFTLVASITASELGGKHESGSDDEDNTGQTGAGGN